jgi:hypothetical protein
MRGRSMHLDGSVPLRFFFFTSQTHRPNDNPTTFPFLILWHCFSPMKLHTRFLPWLPPNQPRAPQLELRTAGGAATTRHVR